MKFDPVISAIVMIVFGMFVFIALASYHSTMMHQKCIEANVHRPAVDVVVICK